MTSTAIKLNKNQILELKSLYTFGEGGTVWPTKDAVKFDKLGVVELGNPVEGDQTQIRISVAGREYLKDLEPGVDTGSNSNDNGNQSGDNAEAKPKGVPTVSKFEIEANIPLPTKTRGTRKSAFPFDALEIGQSFFVPNDNFKSGDAAKSLASTVNNANKQHSEVIEGETKLNRKKREVPVTKQLRQFIVRADVKQTEAGPVEGARVFRVALDAE
jgi:hypothetical protein